MPVTFVGPSGGPGEEGIQPALCCCAHKYCEYLKEDKWCSGLATGSSSVRYRLVKSCLRMSSKC